MFQAEQLIADLLAQGENFADLIAGARRYAAYVQAQDWENKDRYTKGPANWLKARGWLDDWSTRTAADKRPAKAPQSPAKAPAKAGKGGAASGPAKGSPVDQRGREVWPPWQAWSSIRLHPTYRKAWKEEAAARVARALPELWPILDGPRPCKIVSGSMSTDSTMRALDVVAREREWLNSKLKERAEDNRKRTP